MLLLCDVESPLDSSRFHLVVFNVIALVVQDTHCLVTYDGMEWLPGLVMSPVPPPLGVGVVHLGQRVHELSFV